MRAYLEHMSDAQDRLHDDVQDTHAIAEKGYMVVADVAPWIFYPYVRGNSEELIGLLFYSRRSHFECMLPTGDCVAIDDIENSPFSASLGYVTGEAAVIKVRGTLETDVQICEGRQLKQNMT